MNAQQALDVARMVAVAARATPTAANLAAVRSAVTLAARLAGPFRIDAVARGYNPYRDKGGKFAPGAHKQRPKSDRVASAAAAVEKHGARVQALGKRLAVHTASHAAAIGEARLALETARARADAARAKPTQRNIKAAQAATNKATRAVAKVGKLEATVGKAAATHAAAVAKHEAAKTKHAEIKAKTKGGDTPGKSTKAKVSPAAKPKAAEPGPAPVPRPATKPPAAAKPQQSEVTGAKPVDDAGLQRARDHFAKALTPEEFHAVADYRGSFFGTINRSLRGIPNTRDLEEAQLVNHNVKLLDSALEKNRIASPVITYRGVESHPAFANMKPGDVYVDHAYASTSTEKESAMGGSHLFHITSPAGTKLGAIVADSSGFTGAWGGEKEMLLGRGTAFRLDRVESVRNTDHPNPKYHYDQTVFHMTVVGQR